MEVSSRWKSIIHLNLNHPLCLSLSLLAGGGQKEEGGSSCASLAGGRKGGGKFWIYLVRI